MNHFWKASTAAVVSDLGLFVLSIFLQKQVINYVM